MFMHGSRFVCVGTIAATLALSLCVGCSSDGSSTAPIPEQALTVEGASGTMFGATVKTYAVLSENGSVSKVGFTVPLASIQAAPSGPAPAGPPAPAIVLPFPSQVSEETFANHLEINWEPMGHIPPVYEVPHFDFHVYRMTPEQVAAIDCRDKTPIPADRLPPGYVAPPPTAPDACVPKMGIHASPASDFGGTPTAVTTFTKTMILGYYGGNLTFVEPMVTREQLLARKSFELAIPKPASLGSGKTQFPTRFVATYDASSDAYRMELRDFVAAE